MCGIAGAYTVDQLEIARVRDAMTALRHRGPDASGRYRHAFADRAHVDLVHTRLSIIDLDPRSNQPFRLGSRVLVYNGEIYNFHEVRADLEKLGRTFRTSSDTEVLLQAWEQWGAECLDRLEGMWSFAIFDEATGELVLSRDRFSEKPLFVHVSDSGVLFASEPKAIFAMRGEALPIDRGHLARFLTLGHRFLYKSGSTFFEGLTEVEPASVMRIRPSGSGFEVTSTRYWNVPDYTPNESLTYDEVVAEVQRLVVRSMELRLRADVPVAFCMSGGVDSNSLIAVAKRALGYDVHGFTIMNEDARYDERDLVASSVAQLGLRHTPVPVSTEDFPARIAQLVRQHDGPVSTISYYAHWLLMGAVSEAGYRISVSGTGADELFTGYFDHHLMYLAEMAGDPDHAAMVEAWRASTGQYVRNPLLQDPDHFVRNPASRAHLAIGASPFDANTPEQAFPETAYVASLLRNRMLNELFHEVVPVILHEDDLNAMSFSIENRSPFLDRHLLEFMMTVPTRLLVRDGYMKAPLRDAMRPFAPADVLDCQRKVGFNAPLFSFLDVRDRAVRAWLAEDSPVFEWVDRTVVEELLSRETLPNSESKFLFNFVNTKVFLETYT